MQKEQIYVVNAGLVLANNYVLTLFRKLGLLSDNTFIDDKARSKGVLCLEYLVTGLSEPMEHQLTLNKLLCGVPLELVAPLSVEISESEKKLIDALLNPWMPEPLFVNWA